ncbi:hypothetical protein ACQKMD_01275 [Viridibacillus sp. NPDC096237]|uniref:hypothetical protein n=1 Tax=Viridibacillus sp. NPDC096237 TaxID=3390721 RepID=UPI003D040B45
MSSNEMKRYATLMVNGLINFRGNINNFNNLIYDNKPLAASYLAMAHSDINSVNVVYKSFELDNEEIDVVFEEYNKYKSEVDEILINNSNNISWFSASHKVLIESIDKVEEFITDFIRNN